MIFTVQYTGFHTRTSKPQISLSPPLSIPKCNILFVPLFSSSFVPSFCFFRTFQPQISVLLCSSAPLYSYMLFSFYSSLLFLFSLLAIPHTQYHNISFLFFIPSFQLFTNPNDFTFPSIHIYSFYYLLSSINFFANTQRLVCILLIIPNSSFIFFLLFFTIFLREYSLPFTPQILYLAVCGGKKSSFSIPSIE